MSELAARHALTLADIRPAVEEARECVICMSTPRAARFGCGHSACCETCAEELQTRRERCP
eukprot:6046555-Prymnesium_polylepis.1